jgi:hypothetical protein
VRTLRGGESVRGTHELSNTEGETRSKTPKECEGARGTDSLSRGDVKTSREYERARGTHKLSSVEG